MRCHEEYVLECVVMSANYPGTCGPVESVVMPTNNLEIRGRVRHGVMSTDHLGICVIE